jgi:CHAD domain-containing protein
MVVARSTSKRARRALANATNAREARLAAGAVAAGAGVAAAATVGRRAGLLGNGGANGHSGPPRTYRLRRSEPVAAGVRRIALGRIDDALEHLRGDGDPVEAVHEARKDMKKLRSLLRLVRPAIGDEVYRRENERFRDAAALLSDVRDAQVRLETFDSLVERFADELPPGGFAGFRRSLAEDERGLDADELRPTMRLAAEAIEAGRERVAEWPLDGADWELVADGLRRQYRRGRARRDDALAESSTPALHEWRKRAKDHWYHLRLVRNSWRAVLTPTADAAHALSDRLGDDHDLALLRDVAAERSAAFADPDEQLALLELVDRRRAELEAEAFAIGSRIYADKPNALARRLARYWVAWRGPARGAT